MSTLEQRIQEMYRSVPEHTREDVVEAGIWARDALTRHEGEGHILVISASDYVGYKQPRLPGGVCCSFAKPSWGGDHCGRAMETGAQAIVMAVCEYLCGA